MSHICHITRKRERQAWQLGDASAVTLLDASCHTCECITPHTFYFTYWLCVSNALWYAVVCGMRYVVRGTWYVVPVLCVLHVMSYLLRVICYVLTCLNVFCVMFYVVCGMCYVLRVLCVFPVLSYVCLTSAQE